MTERPQIFDWIKQSTAYAERASRALPGDTGSAGIFFAFFLSVWRLLTLAFTVGIFWAGMANKSSFLAMMGIVPALMKVFGVAHLAQYIPQRRSVFQCPNPGRCCHCRQ